MNTTTEKEFRNGVMPRAQLSLLASKLAVEKASLKDAKEFAGFELMEAIAVIDLLKDAGTAVPPLSEEGRGFIDKLKAVSGKEFDQLYMQAELSNHEYLRDLADNYLKTDGAQPPASEKGTQRLAALALFAFTEHVALSKRINRQLAA